MIINTAGDYTLRYTATDECGNSSSVDRSLTVESLRTVLYADGTFIINEAPADKAANEALHGVATNVYIPFDPNGATNAERYIFASSEQRPWYQERSTVESVEIGSLIYPTSTENWFYGFNHCTSMNLALLNTSLVTTMRGMFRLCYILTSIDLSNFDTSNVTNMGQMFIDCNALVEVDMSSFNTSNLTGTSEMFRNDKNLESIYVSQSFSVDSVSANNSYSMFYNMSNKLVGGAGTTWSSSNPWDKTYARIDNPPDAPGYFTLKTT